MRLEVTGRHVSITPTLRRLVERKLGKLDRLLNDGAVSAQVVLSEVPRARRVDITVHARGEHFLHGAAEGATFDTAVGRAVERLAQQAKKVKGRWQERKRPPRSLEAAPVETAPAPAPRRRSRPVGGRPVLQTARVVVRFMTVSDALKAFETSADPLLIFRDAETTALSVLMRRAGGELTLLETEA
jgi:putative sigma-54 modulation protein